MFDVDKKLEFPTSYPSGCLLGCVNVEDCLERTEYMEQVMWKLIHTYFVLNTCLFNIELSNMKVVFLDIIGFANINVGIQNFYLFRITCVYTDCNV